MEKYKSLFLWMVVPMIVMQVGIFGDYWGDFSENSWSVHVHYFTGTIWYIYLIVQPYLATHGKLALHRTNGLIGLFLAGGVCLTALSMMSRDIDTVQKSIEFRDNFGPFEPWFFYGVMVVEVVMMSGFGFAIIKSIIHRKSLEDHAWWLIVTVFIIMMPALGRGMQTLYIGMNNARWPNIDIMIPVYFTQAIIIGMLFLGAWKYNKLKHPATWFAFGVNIFVLLLEPIGRNVAIQEFLTRVVLR